jgi:hypothetical protein
MTSGFHSGTIDCFKKISQRGCHRSFLKGVGANALSDSSDAMVLK